MEGTSSKKLTVGMTVRGKTEPKQPFITVARAHIATSSNKSIRSSATKVRCCSYDESRAFSGLPQRPSIEVRFNVRHSSTLQSFSRDRHEGGNADKTRN